MFASEAISISKKKEIYSPTTSQTIFRFSNCQVPIDLNSSFSTKSTQKHQPPLKATLIRRQSGRIITINMRYHRSRLDVAPRIFRFMGIRDTVLFRLFMSHSLGAVSTSVYFSNVLCNGIAAVGEERELCSHGLIDKVDDRVRKKVGLIDDLS